VILFLPSDSRRKRVFFSFFRDPTLLARFVRVFFYLSTDGVFGARDSNNSDTAFALALFSARQRRWLFHALPHFFFLSCRPELLALAAGFSSSLRRSFPFLPYLPHYGHVIAILPSLDPSEPIFCSRFPFALILLSGRRDPYAASRSTPFTGKPLRVLFRFFCV